MRTTAASLEVWRPAGAQHTRGASDALLSRALPSAPRSSRLSVAVRCMINNPGDGPSSLRRESQPQPEGRLHGGQLRGCNNIVPVPMHRDEEADALQLAMSGMSLEEQKQLAADNAALPPQQQQPAGASDSGGGGNTSPRPSSTARLAAAAPGQLDGMHKPVGLVVGSAWLLSFSVQLAGTAALTPLWLPAIAGGLLGGLASAAGHVGARKLWRGPARPLRVVVTGGSAGIGKALAREFLRCGDHVVITSRTLSGAAQAAEQLRAEVPGARVSGVACDVSNAASVEALMAAAQEQLGGLDCLVNNAGYSGSFKSLLDQSAEQVEQVVRTNLLGSLLATRAGMRAMAAQPGGTPAHIFNLEGAGSDGSATPKYAAYGATKAAIGQLLGTLRHEAAALRGPTPVCVHNLSPGMVLTDLLLEGATAQNKQVFNILCEHPETVAAFLVPRARSVVARGASGTAIRYLTPQRALLKFLAAPLHQGRYFDRHGRAVYLPESERLSGGQARRTQRLQERAASRSGALAMAYSLSMALSFFLIVSDALAKSPPVH